METITSKIYRHRSFLSAYNSLIVATVYTGQLSVGLAFFLFPRVISLAVSLCLIGTIGTKLLNSLEGRKFSMVCHFTGSRDWLSLIRQINVDLSRQFRRRVRFAVRATYIIEAGRSIFSPRPLWKFIVSPTRDTWIFGFQRNGSASSPVFIDSLGSL